MRLIPAAQYVPEQDAYRVVGARDGYAQVAVLSDEEKKIARAEYDALKKSMLTVTAAAALGCTVAAALFFGFDAARAYAYGALGSLLYLWMLQGGTDTVGESSIQARVYALRLFVPVIPFLALAVQNVGSTDAALLLGSVSKREALALVLGLLTYKVPIVAKTASEFVDAMASIQMGSTGMVGTVAGLAARQIKKKRDGNGLEEPTDAAVTNKRVFVFAGPSGVGKNTLINSLMEDFPDRFGYSVSHTTRPAREGEVDGEDYNFVTKDQFEEMISKGQFVEYAKVHTSYYGTSYDAVEVVGQNACCVLDLDVQGVESVQKRREQGLDWEIRFVWVAPPSVEALEERLRRRGSETDAQIKGRLDTAIREMSFAARSNVFDIIVVNDKLEDAYQELKTFIAGEIGVGN